LLVTLLQEMRWKFGLSGRMFRRLWTVMVYSQLISPFVALLAILTASALGIDTDSSITQSPVESSTDNINLSLDIDSDENKLELVHSVDISRDVNMFPRKNGVLDSCCKQPTVRPCPLNIAPRKERCLRSDHSHNLCSTLSLDCVQCQCDYSCQYGEISKANCSVITGVECEGERKFSREFECRYCYLTDEAACSNQLAASCSSTAPYTQLSHWYVASCFAKRDLVCLGSARFSKKLECSWTEGYSWKTALALSITLGGFGADRFYLGYWQEGIGKLFSFGGLGVWTLVDVILVAVRYIGPADGSLYI